MILVTGLPRSGSMSVSVALNKLNYKTLFYCPIVNKGKDWIGEDLENYEAIVDWSISGIMGVFLATVEVSKVIFLTRRIGLEESLENLLVNGSIKRYYYEDLESGIKVVKHREIPYTILDIVNSPRWDDLCRFLDKPIPEETFPHLNKSEFNWNI